MTIEEITWSWPCVTADLSGDLAPRTIHLLPRETVMRYPDAVADALARWRVACGPDEWPCFAPMSDMTGFVTVDYGVAIVPGREPGWWARLTDRTLRTGEFSPKERARLLAGGWQAVVAERAASFGGPDRPPVSARKLPEVTV